MPQSYSWAQESQVDWYEAWVDLGDARTKVQIFTMRSMASGAAFHRAYLHATQQAFLEAHEHFRRNHLVRVPCVADLDALNALLLSGCRADEARVLDGRTQSVGAALVEERSHLLSRVTEGFDLADVVFPLVDKQGCVAVKTNFYSVPARAGIRVEARVYPLHVEVWHAGRLIARDERCHSRRSKRR